MKFDTNIRFEKVQKPADLIDAKKGTEKQGESRDTCRIICNARKNYVISLGSRLGQDLVQLCMCDCV